MKKIIYSSLFVLIANISGFAQAALPTSYSWGGAAYPSGWSAVDPSPSYYTSSSSAHTTPSSLKMDASGDKVIINFASTQGTLTYWLNTNSFSGGTFIVEESQNGSAWTTLRPFTTYPSAWTQYTDMPNSASRYVRFNYSNKVSGNIALDDVTLTAGVSTSQEISIKQGTTSIVNGGTYSVGSAVGVLTPITFTVNNLGSVSSLNVTSATLSGPAVADYSVATATPFTVTALSNTSLTVNFTPSTAGTRNAF